MYPLMCYPIKNVYLFDKIHITITVQKQQFTKILNNRFTRSNKVNYRLLSRFHQQSFFNYNRTNQQTHDRLLFPIRKVYEKDIAAVVYANTK